MAYFSVIELVRMDGERDDVKSLALQLMNAFQAKTGKRTFVPPDGGFRTHARQAELYAQMLVDAQTGDVYKTASPGMSAHEWGAGFDLHVLDNPQDADYTTLADLAESLGMRAGLRFGDPFHFETDESLGVWQAKFAASAGRSLPVLAIGGLAIAAAILIAHEGSD